MLHFDVLKPHCRFKSESQVFSVLTYCAGRITIDLPHQSLHTFCIELLMSRSVVAFVDERVLIVQRAAESASAIIDLHRRAVLSAVGQLKVRKFGEGRLDFSNAEELVSSRISSSEQRQVGLEVGLGSLAEGKLYSLW